MIFCSFVLRNVLKVVKIYLKIFNEIILWFFDRLFFNISGLFFDKIHFIQDLRLAVLEFWNEIYANNFVEAFFFRWFVEIFLIHVENHFRNFLVRRVGELAENVVVLCLIVGRREEETSNGNVELFSY